MRTAAILPVKRFALAKQRLGQSVGDPLRRDLAQAMVADVLGVLLALEALELTVVITNEPSVADLAGDQGATVVPDTLEAGQSAAAALGLEHARARGAERALLVAGDCPAIDGDELERLLAHPAEGPALVIVPDRHGTGTNALLLTPCEVISPAFGPDSSERHRLLALAAGAHCRVERVESLALDIDTGADLQALRERLSAEDERTHAAGSRAGARILAGAGRAQRTRAVLAAAAQAPLAPDPNLTPAP